MQLFSVIQLHLVQYAIPNQRALFNDLNLSLARAKYGLVGKNGVGKSSLLQLIMRELMPHAGSIIHRCQVQYCPQNPVINVDNTIAELLQINEKVQALQRIQAGSSNLVDYELLDDDWGILDRSFLHLSTFKLQHFPLQTTINQLSGGEMTRLLLAKAFWNVPGFVILDEPTNNLDKSGREFLYSLLQQWQGGLLIVSHDRQLLNLMDQIILLNTHGLRHYGGNYDFFREQRELEDSALHQDMQEAKRTIKLVQRNMQKTREMIEQKQSYGRQQFEGGRVDRMLADIMKERSEKTQHRQALQKDDRLQQAVKQLEVLRDKSEINHSIAISLPNTHVPVGKVVLTLDNLSFSYAGDEHPIIHQFSLQLVGPARVALIGNNGAGKTTLVKLIQQQLLPQLGSIEIGVKHTAYVDQHANALQNHLSVLDNFHYFNPEINRTDAQHYLAQFLFRNEAAMKPAAGLSGGERLRALLACILMAKHAPQLIILDEPTNHLDLESLTSLESALNCYAGAMMVISHDHAFLERINIKDYVEAPFIGR